MILTESQSSLHPVAPNAVRPEAIHRYVSGTHRGRTSGSGNGGGTDGRRCVQSGGA